MTNDSHSCAIFVEACGADAEVGYTTSYTPVAATSLADPYESDLIAGVDTEKIGSDEYVNCSLYVGEVPTKRKINKQTNKQNTFASVDALSL